MNKSTNIGGIKMFKGQICLEGNSILEKTKLEIKKNREIKLNDYYIRDSRKTPLTAVIISVGDDNASSIYVKNKIKDCTDVGFICKHIHFNSIIDTDCIIRELNNLAKDETVHGIIVQLPLPTHINKQRVFKSIPEGKDLDCVNPINVGKLSQDYESVIALPCTPHAILEILPEDMFIRGINCVILSRSDIIGKPLATMLIQQGATVTVCNSNTPVKQRTELLQLADLVVTAVGVPDFLVASEIKQGAVVIDVSINTNKEGKLCGDVKADTDFFQKVKAYTPVPGGVGPATRAMFLDNLYCLDKYSI